MTSLRVVGGKGGKGTSSGSGGDGNPPLCTEMQTAVTNLKSIIADIEAGNITDVMVVHVGKEIHHNGYTTGSVASELPPFALMGAMQQACFELHLFVADSIEVEE